MQSGGKWVTTHLNSGACAVDEMLLYHFGAFDAYSTIKIGPLPFSGRAFHSRPCWSGSA